MINENKSLSNLVAIDGWSERSDDGSTHTIFADVSFGEARMGGEASSPVRFRLALHRCELVLVVPRRELLKVIPKSVARSKPTELEVFISKEAQKKKGASGGLDLSLSAIKALFKAEVSGSTAEIKRTQQNDTIRLLNHTHGKSEDGHHCWRLTNVVGEHLEGAPWIATDTRLVSLKDGRSIEQQEKDKSNSMSPVVGVEIRCKREDIDVYDIKLKKADDQQAAESRQNHDTRLAAAEGVIKTALTEQGLEFGRLEEVFSDISLAEFMITIE